MNKHLSGAGLALLGFAGTLVIGLAVDNPFTTIVTRALGVLVLFYPLGYLLALVGAKVVQENFEMHEKQVRAAVAAIPAPAAGANPDLPAVT